MWRTPGLLPLFAAKLISTCGSWLTVLALSWFVLVTTGSPARMSAVLTAEFLGVVLLGQPSGRLVVFAATVNTRFTLRAPVEIRPHVMTAMASVESLAYFVAFAATGPALQIAGLGPVFAGIAVLATAGAVAFHAALRADRHGAELVGVR
jgi:hypothetical protein